MKHEMPEEVKDNIREGAFIEWLKRDASDWGHYPTDIEAPEASDPEDEILDYINAVKERSKEIRQELIDSGADEYDVEYETPVWPLEDDAPMDVVRAYLSYLEENLEAASKGIIID